MDLGVGGKRDDALKGKIAREFEEKLLRMDWDKEQHPVMYLLSKYGEAEAKAYLRRTLPVTGMLEELAFKDHAGRHQPVPDSTIDHRMAALAKTYQPFELSRIIPEEVNAAEHAIDPRTPSSNQAKRSFGEAVSELYRPVNEKRGAYLSSKYQMYLNEQIRADLATSILEAKGQLAELNSSRQDVLRAVQK